MAERSPWRRSFARALALAAIASAAAATGAASSAAGKRDDPLQAPDCRRALASLQAQETAADAALRARAGAGDHARPAPSSELQAARRLAAKSCLASRADPPLPPGRLIQPPIVVAPLAVARPAVPPTARLRPPLTAPPTAERPYAVTSCDPGGCWANDGSRLNRVGPTLWGQHGVCTLQGTLLQCP
jgi:hypothetical protein